MARLTDSQIEQFRRDGYLVVKSVLRPKEFDAARDDYANLIAEKSREWAASAKLAYDDIPAPGTFHEQLYSLSQTGSFRGELLAELDLTLPHMPFSVITPSSPYYVGPGALSLLKNESVLDVVRSILGDEISSSPNQHIRLKLPVRRDPGQFGGRRGELMHAPTMWHQDAQTHIPESDDTEMLTCWIPLSDVDRELGCLKVVPGGHLSGSMLPWPIGEEMVAELEAQAVELPVELGDVILLDKRIPHGSTVNSTDAVRWSFDFRFFPTDQATDRPWFPNIVVASAEDPASVVADAAEWDSLWQRCRAELADLGEPLPGRREFAQLVTEAQIRRWETGEYPTFASSVAV